MTPGDRPPSCVLTQALAVSGRWRRAWLAAAILSALGGAGACGPLEGETPHLVVHPEVVYLPAVADGQPASAAAALLNLGAGPLRIESLISTAPGALEVREPPTPLTIAPGASVEVALRYYSPSPSPAAVEIAAGAPGAPAVMLPVIPPAVTPVLWATPRAVGFGAVASGSVAQETIVLESLGRAAATGVRLEWSSPAGDFAAQLPTDRLELGEQALLEVSYRPTGGDADQATLLVTWSAGQLTIPLSGRQDLTAPH